MSRLLALAAILPVVFLSAPLRSAAAAPPPVRTVHVLVKLQGSPLAADPFLRDRSATTRYRFRFDPALRPSRVYAAALTRYQNDEIGYIRSQGISLTTDYRFNVLFDGFGARVPASQLNHLRALRNVASVRPQRTYRPLEDGTLSGSLPLVNVSAAWDNLGGPPQAGHGVLIAQIDTGIDIKHPCFSDASMPAPPFRPRADSTENAKLVNNKVIIARAYGANNGQQYSAADALGHGTFGAALEACDYSTPTPIGTHFSGMAPRAWLANYNVFPGNSAGTSDSQILAALQAAELDGVDVVNMSLGSALGTGDPRLDDEIQAVGLMVKAGISVVVSAGNAGPTAQTVSSPSSTPEAIAVGAVSNAQGIYSSITVGGSSGVPASLQRVKAKEGSHAWTGDIGPAQVVYVGLGLKPGDDSKHPSEDDFAGKDLQGKIALITRGTAFFETKINNAAKAGAIGAIVIDNVDETNVLAMDTLTATLPAMGMTKQEGSALQAWVSAHPDATVSMHSAVSAFPETPDILTGFSSRGYGLDYGIKPDLVAPGQDIYAPTESETPNNEMYDPSGFTSQNGTSFSAPHVTGAVALLLQEHPKWTPAMIKAVLMNTANSGVYLDPEKTQVASVMDAGAGLLNIGAAVAAPAYVLPASLSLGALNLAESPGTHDSTLTINDASGGAGTWQASVQPLHGANGLNVTVPASVVLAQNGHADLTVHVVASGTPNGDYDGYIVLQKDQTTLHVPYFIHLLTQAVKPGSVLLVDDTTSNYQAPPGKPQVAHLDVSSYYFKALQALGKPYTYWNEASLGPPSLAELKQASSVIYFTGNNVNAWASSDPESLTPPLNVVDLTNLHSYLDAGGQLFITGMGAAESDGNWVAIVLGAEASVSAYDNLNNDPNKLGGISPPQPSAAPDTGVGPLQRAGIFAGLKPIDFSTKGDGAGDNLAIRNTALDGFGLDGLVGIPGLTPLSGKFGTDAANKPANAYGQPALKMTNPSNSDGGSEVAVVSSDEPSLKHTASYPGRSVLFSFGFEGINDNTGYATRQQVLQRIFAWFADHPTAHVSSSTYRSGSKVQLRATFRAQGATAAEYIWQVGNTELTATGKPTQYRFPHAGRYRLRVQITDTLGHTALSPWTTVTVH